MSSGVKGASAAVIFGISYINHIFSPLIWALLVLIVIDVLLNVHKEGQQLTKIGSAFATLGGTSLITVQNTFSLEVVHGLVAVMVLAYIQVVIPQVVQLINKAKFIAPTAKMDIIAALQAENEALKQKATAEANKVVVTPGEQK